MKMNQLFVDAINKGFEAAKLITEGDKKAIAYAELAKAVAMTGLVGANAETAEPEKEKNNVEKEEKKTTNNKGKGSLKAGADKGKAKTTTKEEVAPLVEEEIETPPAVEEEIPAPVEETKEETPAVTEGNSEVELVAEWTDEMCTLKAEQLGTLNAYVDAWGDDYVYKDCLLAFSEQAFSGSENVTPLNIDGFTDYLVWLGDQAE